MSRELQFRAWDGRKFHYPTEIQSGYSPSNPTMLAISFPSEGPGYCTTDHYGVYTGFKDKSGNMIWEGDIVLQEGYYYGDHWNKESLHEVQFQDGQFWPDHMTKTSGAQVFVVGNIYENNFEEMKAKYILRKIMKGEK